MAERDPETVFLYPVLTSFERSFPHSRSGIGVLDGDCLDETDPLGKGPIPRRIPERLTAKV